MTTCIIAEKPSVARDIARIVGATRQQDGFIEGKDYLVTWAFGHLITLAPARTLWTRDIQGRRTPHPPSALSAHRSTNPQREILRRRPDSPQTAKGDPILPRACRADHRRYRCRKRRRAHLPLHLHLPRLPIALPTAMVLLPHRQGNSGGTSQAQTWGAV